MHMQFKFSLVIIINHLLYISSLDINIRRLEKRHNITSMWNPDEDCYVQALQRSVCNRKLELLEILKTKCAERQYNLSLIKTYAGM